MKRLWFFLIVVGVITAAGACAWYLWQKHEAEHIACILERVERRTLDETVNATGRVLPREVYVVGSESAGKVNGVEGVTSRIHRGAAA